MSNLILFADYSSLVMIEKSNEVYDAEIIGTFHFSKGVLVGSTCTSTWYK